MSSGEAEDLVGMQLMASFDVVYYVNAKPNTDSGLWVCADGNKSGIVTGEKKKEETDGKFLTVFILVHCRMGQAKLHEKVRLCAASECGLCLSFPCT